MMIMWKHPQENGKNHFAWWNGELKNSPRSANTVSAIYVQNAYTCVISLPENRNKPKHNR
jgi:hypothetical protein